MDDMTTRSKILIVDDNPHNVYSFQALLSAPEVDLLTAASGAQALQLLLDHPDVSIVVMDVQMPGMDGFETAELIRAYPKFQDIPILFITAVYRSDQFARRGFRAGASDYITKPVDNEVLLSKVNVFLTLQRQKRQLVREIEARGKAEAQVRHLNTVLKAILDVNQLIIREKDPARLVQQACDCLVEARGFESAWIALLDNDGGVTITVEAGLGQAFAPLSQALEHSESGTGPLVLRQARVGAAAAPDGHSNLTAAGALDPREGITVRLQHGDKFYGLLAVSFPPGIVADAEEQALLAEVAGDLAFALYGIEQEEARRQAEEALVQAERLSAMGRLAASLAHEINNPLQAVVGCLELTSELLEESDEAGRYMTVAVAELRRAARITQQLRDLGRHTRDHTELSGVGELLDTVLTLTHNRTQSQSVQVILEGEEMLLSTCMVPRRVQQVFLNLLLNAVDAMPDGGDLCIRLARTYDPPGVELVFADTGVGIAPEDLEQMFEAFHSTKEVGLGLGLYISRSIVQDHQGWIDVQSEVGRGTTFTVWLPGEGLTGVNGAALPERQAG
jgi:signal transduction histidine kinase/CheY-like chemotaxis protein